MKKKDLLALLEELCNKGKAKRDLRCISTTFKTETGVYLAFRESYLEIEYGGMDVDCPYRYIDYEYSALGNYLFARKEGIKIATCITKGDYFE